MTGVIRRGKFHVDTETHEAKRKGLPRIVGKHQKLKEGRKDSPLRV